MFMFHIARFQRSILSLLLFLPTMMMAQNQPPQISNLEAVQNESQGEVTITYDLSDAENDDVDVTLQASADQGTTYLVPIANVSGDVGYPISPGSNLQITWNYPDSLSPAIDTYRVKLVADDRQSINIQQIVNRVDSQRLKNDVLEIAGVRHASDGRAHLNEVKDTLESRFKNYGLQVSRQSFSLSGTSYTGENIIGRLQGHQAEDTTYIIDAHFDGVQGSPGADDNASGTAGVLEAARILSVYNFDHSIRFIGFDQEEKGLVGSEAYVNFGIKSYEHVQGVLNFEMIGYYSEEKNSQNFPNGFDLLFPNAYSQVEADSFRGDFIANVANDTSMSLKNAFDSAAAQYVPGLDVVSIAVSGTGQIAPDLRRSDHASFWDKGYQALMLTNTSEFRNPNYHTANDTIGSLNFTFMRNVVKATIAAVCEEAGIQHSTTASKEIQSISHASSFEPGSHITMYPNPADEQVHIHFREDLGDAVDIDLYDQKGQLIYQKDQNILHSDQVSIGLSELEPGIYHLSLHGTDKHVHKKLLVY